MSTILNEGLILTDNLRQPLRTSYQLAELASPLSLSDGSRAPGELLRLKNGTASEQARYEQARCLFHAFTGRGLNIGMRVTADLPDAGQGTVEVLPLVTDGGRQAALANAGAGAHEALLLATLLSNTEQVIVLDEPAVQLAVGAQHRVLAELRRHRGQPGQLVLITHSPDMVPASTPDDLGSILRFARGEHGAQVHRLPAAGDGADLSRWAQLLRTSDVRGLLFAEGVLLTEGPTEAGALERWLADPKAEELASPDDANIRIISVDGDTAFGGYVDLLEAFGIPWAILCDGPALRRESAMYGQLCGGSKLESLDGVDAENFGAVRSWWARKGVFTLASDFGDDGSKSGEFEAFLRCLDEETLIQVNNETRSKVRIGCNFADRVSLPRQVIELWVQVVATLSHRREARMSPGKG